MGRRLGVLLGVGLLVLGLVSAALPASLSAAADTCTWTGATSTNWSVGGNWSGCDNGGVPETGDELLFPNGASNLTMTNNLNIIPADVTFNGDGYHITGNALELSGSLNIYAEAHFDSGVTFTASGASNRTLSYQDAAAVLPSNIQLNLTSGANLQVFSTVPSLPMPTFSGTVQQLAIVGAASGGQRSFIASSDSTVTAALVVLARATVICQSANCLGDSSNPVTITNGNSNGAVLSVFTDNLTLDYPITLDSSFDGPPTIQIDGSAVRLRGGITVASNALITVSSGKSLTIGGAGNSVDISSGTTLALNGSSHTDTINITDEITGSGVLNVAGGYTSVLETSPSFSGNAIVDDGGVLNTNGAALGTASGGLYINSGGTARFNSGSATVIADPVTVSGSGSDYASAAILSDNQAVEFTATMSINDAVIDNRSSAGVPVTFNNAILGTGDLTLKQSAGSTSNSYVIAATSANGFTGMLKVVGAIATLNGSAQAVPHGLSIEATTARAARVTIAAANQIGPTSTIATAKNGSSTAELAINTATVTVGAVTGDGAISFQSTGKNLTVGNGGASGNFSGTIAGSGNTITKVGSGTWDLTGASRATPGDGPAFVINEGAILFGGSLADSPVTVGSGATLKGTGAIGDTTIQNGGTVNVGTSPGCLTMSSLTLASGSVFTQEINGATPCSGYDQTTVTGTADLGGATLDVNVSYVPTTSTTFTILTAADVNGTFNGLPNGATLTVNGIALRINYTDTTVTLSYVAPNSLANTGTSAVLPTVAGIALLTVASAVTFVRWRKKHKLSL